MVMVSMLLLACVVVILVVACNTELRLGATSEVVYCLFCCPVAQEASTTSTVGSVDAEYS